MFSYIAKLFTSSKIMVSAEVKAKVDQWIKEDHVFVASKSYCPYCRAAKQLLEKKGAKAHIEELDKIEDGSEIQEYLKEISGQSTVPNIYIDGKHIGGSSDLQSLETNGKLSSLL